MFLVCRRKKTTTKHKPERKNE